MIKKMRLKFIVAVLASLLVVLVLILGAVNLVNYRKVVNDADDLLYLLDYNGGAFPGSHDKGTIDSIISDANKFADSLSKNGELISPHEVRSSENTDATSETAEYDENETVFPFISKRDDSTKETRSFDDDGNGNLQFNYGDEESHGNITISPEAPYETRYFVVNLTSEKEKETVDLGMIAAVDESTAVSYAQQVVNGGNGSGFIGSYRYYCSGVLESGGYRVIFLDCTSKLSSFRSFLLASVIIAAGGWLIMGVLIIFLSGRIIKPFVDNYEKQKRFITDAGHELKTPLAIISADVEVMEMDYGEDNEWLQDIKDQAVRLTELTNDLIMLSKMEESPDKAQILEFPLSDVAQEIATPFNSRAIADGKILTINIEPMISINGQEKAIRQLISILLDNACKYSLPESEIKFALSKSGRNAVISVFNSCEPISKDKLEHMFDRFYRADESHNSLTGGYGIGLAIAQAIVAGHKGKISATSLDGNSITITAIIPLGTIDP